MAVDVLPDLKFSSIRVHVWPVLYGIDNILEIRALISVHAALRFP